jgi:FkbM family methyltransferase
MPYRKIFFLLLIMVFSACHAEDKSLFMGLIIKDNDASVPTFLKKIEELDYDKRAIRLKIAMINDNPEMIKIVNEWCTAQEEKYGNINLEMSKLNPAAIKNSFLYEDPESEWIFITSSDVFLRPFTLRTLMSKNLPIVAPLLRPLPLQNILFRNFFLSATENGYYKEDPGYADVMDRKKIGTFRADCVHGAYLIRTNYAYKLNFEDGSFWDFIAFSNTARKNGVPQFICNEKEFGHFIHTEDSQKELAFPWMDRQVTRTHIQEISKDFLDQGLQKYQEAFPIEKYTLYPVQDDVYWVDEKWDWIKSHYIKKGLVWEPHIEKLFKKYVKAGDTVIDIGGHIGTHTIVLSRCVGPSGKVHTFEPQTKIFLEMLVNTSLNNCKNIIPHRVALGAIEGEACIAQPCTTNEGMGRISPYGERVPVKTLDSFNISPVSLMKIDIEGYEIEALKGAKETIQRNKPVIIVEVFTGPESTERLNFIRNLGYEISHLGGDDYLCLPSSSH